MNSLANRLAPGRAGIAALALLGWYLMVLPPDTNLNNPKSVALERVGEGLVEACLEIRKAPRGIALTQLWFALACDGDIDRPNA